MLRGPSKTMRLEFVGAGLETEVPVCGDLDQLREWTVAMTLVLLELPGVTIPMEADLLDACQRDHFKSMDRTTEDLRAPLLQQPPVPSSRRKPRWKPSAPR